MTRGARETKGLEEGIEPPLGVTARAVIIGATLGVLLAFMAICQQALGGGLEADGFGSGALFLLFALIWISRALKGARLIRTGLQPSELLVIFSMLLMASAVPLNGVMIYLLPHLAGFAHYATPENEWGTIVSPLLPDGLAIKDPKLAKGFFEGQGPRARVPYGAWAGTLLAWTVLLGSVYFTMMSLMVILRKRWIEQERLPFPLAQVPQALVEAQPGERPALRNPVFWCGFGVPALIGSTYILKTFLPFVPAINLSIHTYIYRNSIGLAFYTNFLVMGVSYLVSLEILGSILLFFVIAYVQIYVVTVTGSAILGGGPASPYAHYTQLHQEAMGALAVLVGIGIYDARHHLRQVLRKAVGPAPEIDDSEEIMSYRTAVVAIVLGLVFTCYWLSLTGISTWVIPIFVAVMLITFLGLTRLMAEAGVVLPAPLSPMQVLLHSAGTQVLGASTASGFFLAQPWAFSEGPHVMGSTSSALKLTHRKGARARLLLYALVAALLLSGVTAGMAMLHFGYTRGIYGFTQTTFVIRQLNYILSYYAGAIKTLSEGQPVRLFWSALGAAVMGVLALARGRFFWWPVHPIGFAIGNVFYSWWSSLFVAWLIKRNVLKYGGPSLYGRTRPFFIGMVVGQATISSVGSIITLFTGRV